MEGFSFTSTWSASHCSANSATVGIVFILARIAEGGKRTTGDRLPLVRADVPERSRDGVIAEPGRIDLPRPIKRKERVGYDVYQGVEIFIGETSLALQDLACALVGGTEKCQIT